MGKQRRGIHQNGNCIVAVNRRRDGENRIGAVGWRGKAFVLIRAGIVNRAVEQRNRETHIVGEDLRFGRNHFGDAGFDHFIELRLKIAAHETDGNRAFDWCSHGGRARRGCIGGDAEIV